MGGEVTGRSLCFEWEECTGHRTESGGIVMQLNVLKKDWKGY